MLTPEGSIISAVRLLIPMFSPQSLSNDSNEIGIFHLSLGEKIPAWALRYIIQAIDDLYFGYLWLAKANEGPVADPYEPTEEETLYIYRLDIGTPNFVQFKGQLRALLPVAKVVSLGLGFDKLSVGLLERWRGDEDVAIDTKQTDTELSILKAEEQIRFAKELHEIAQQLYEEGKINDEQRTHKAEIEEMSRLIVQQVMSRYVNNVQVLLQT